MNRMDKMNREKRIKLIWNEKKLFLQFIGNYFKILCSNYTISLNYHSKWIIIYTFSCECIIIFVITFVIIYMANNLYNKLLWLNTWTGLFL